MTEEIQQYFTSYRAPLWNAPVETVPQEVDSQPEVQPTGWVINSSANVFIDEEGLHVLDGAIFIRDYSGESVLSAAGFAGSWLTYLYSGIYNSRFEYGNLGALTYGDSAMSQIPYWYFSARSHTTITATRITDAAAPGGFAIRVQATAATPGVVTHGGVQPQRINVMGGRRILFRALSHVEGVSATYSLQVNADAFWYDRNGTYISSAAVRTLVKTDVYPAGEYRWDVLGVAEAPQNAAYLDVRFGPRWAAGALLNSFLDIAEVQVRQADDDFTEILLGNNVISNFFGVTRIVDDGYPVEFRLSPTVGFDGKFTVLPDGSSYPMSALTSEGIELGGGGSPRDVIMFRSAAGILDLQGELHSYQEAWIAPALLNSWTVYSSYTVGYRKDAMGFVHLRGMVASGTPPSTIFTLPAGYRPGNAGNIFPSAISGGTGRVDIQSGGNVNMTVGNTSWNSLDGITFKAEN